MLEQRNEISSAGHESLQSSVIKVCKWDMYTGNLVCTENTRRLSAETQRTFSMDVNVRVSVFSFMFHFLFISI